MEDDEMRTAILLLIGAGIGAFAQNTAWNYDAFGLAIVWLPGVPFALAAVFAWRKRK